MLVFLKALCARLFTSAVQIVERAQTVFRHLKYKGACTGTWLSRKVVRVMWKGFLKSSKQSKIFSQKCYVCIIAEVFLFVGLVFFLQSVVTN